MKTVQIVNLTPHPLVFADGRVIESSGVARCEQADEEIGQVAGLPIVFSRFGAVEGLPEPRYECHACANCARWDEQNQPQGYCLSCGNPLGLRETENEWTYSKVYVVSSITAQACPERGDVFVPARPIRDEKGRIIGCGALGKILPGIR